VSALTVATAQNDLFDYLAENFDLAQVGTVMEQSEFVLDLTHDMAADFAALYPHFLLLDSYYLGNPPMPREPERLTKKFREMLVMSRSNWCGLIVDVVGERLKISSIRSTTQALQDKQAWQWWQANNMDGVSPRVHLAALKYGLCYVSAWPAKEGKIPRIVGEPPTGCYVRYDADTGRALAAIRIWQDNNCGCVHADLTLPDFQFHLTTKDAVLDQLSIMGAEPRSSRAVTMDVSDVQWQFRTDGEVPPVEVNPLGVVPYVRMLTAPDLLDSYASELDGIIPIQDRIIKTIFDRLLAQSFASFPRAWVTGVEVPEDPVTGQPREPFDAAVDRLWTFTDATTKVGQLDPAELTGYIQVIAADVQALCSVSRTPPSYLMAGMGIFPSGESVRATEWGLTCKVANRQQSYGDAWSDVLRLCGVAAGSKRHATDLGLNVVWDDVEARSESEVVDALIKMGTLGVPWPALWQRWGASPEEIAAWTKQLDEASARAAALASAGGKPAGAPPTGALPPISGSTNPDQGPDTTQP
jgi:Phage portal protein, SPP1 Gp6-like